MQKIFLEKLIDLNHQLKEMVTIAIDDSINYQIETQGIRSIGSVEITGEYTNEAKRKVEFKETLQLDILAPYEKVVDRNEFNVKIQDFDYKIVKGNLLVVIEAVIHGVIPDQERRIVDSETTDDEIPDLFDIEVPVEAKDVMIDDILVQHFDGLLASDFFTANSQDNNLEVAKLLNAKTNSEEEELGSEAIEQMMGDISEDETNLNIESKRIDLPNISFLEEIFTSNISTPEEVRLAEKNIEDMENSSFELTRTSETIELPKVDSRKTEAESLMKNGTSLQSSSVKTNEVYNLGEILENPNSNSSSKTNSLLKKIKELNDGIIENIKLTDVNLENRGEKMNDVLSETIEEVIKTDVESKDAITDELKSSEMALELEGSRMDKEEFVEKNIEEDMIEETDHVEDVAVNMTYDDEKEDVKISTDDYLEDLYEDTDSKYVSYRLYVVNANDSYETIADKYAIPVERLKKFNNNKEIFHKTIVVIPFDE